MAAHLIDSLVVRQRQGYIFDPKESGIGLSKLDLTSVSGHNNNFTATCTDPVTDTLYFIYSPDTLASWATSTVNLEYSWTSKVYQVPYPATFQAAQVRGAPVSGDDFSVLANGASYYTKAITADGEFVLPKPTPGAKTFQVKYEGTGTITTLEVSENMEELL